MKELKGIANSLSDKELNLAKIQLTNDVLLALESQSSRLEEASKNLKVLGDNQVEQYVAKINAVKAEDVKKHVAALLKGTPSLVLQGSLVNQVHSFDKLVNSLKL